jgi:serine/threonine protein kinase
MVETFKARVRGLAGLDRIFAVKCLHRPHGSPAGLDDPFVEIAQRLATIDDPRVARVLDTSVIDGTAVVVREFVHGLDLDRFRECAQFSGVLASGSGEGARKWQKIIAYVGTETARGLLALHRLAPALAHGGLCPRNVIATARGGAKILDAGLGPAVKASATRSRKKRSWLYAGLATPGAAASVQGDLRALGAILFELATGELPPEAAASSWAGQTLAAFWPAMADFVSSLLADDPDARPTAAFAVDALARLWAEVPESSMAAEVAALVANFSTFVTDAGPHSTPAIAQEASFPGVEDARPSSSSAATGVSLPPPLAPVTPAEVDVSPGMAVGPTLPPPTPVAPAEVAVLPGTAVGPTLPPHTLVAPAEVGPGVDGFTLAPLTRIEPIEAGLSGMAETLEALPPGPEPIPESSNWGAQALVALCAEAGIRLAVGSGVEPPAQAEQELSVQADCPPPAQAEPELSVQADCPPPTQAEPELSVQADCPPPTQDQVHLVSSEAQMAPGERPALWGPSPPPSLDPALEQAFTCAPATPGAAPPESSGELEQGLPHDDGLKSGASRPLLAVDLGVLSARKTGIVVGVAAVMFMGGLLATAYFMWGTWRKPRVFAVARIGQQLAEPAMQPSVAHAMSTGGARPTGIGQVAAQPAGAGQVAGVVSPVGARLAAKSPAGSSSVVSVSSEPAGATVWVNGEERGATPCSIKLAVGRARLTLVHPGYRSSTSRFDASDGIRIERKMEPVEAPTTGDARFRAECRTEGKLPIVVDGYETGILCPSSKLRVRPGAHRIGLLIPSTGAVHEKEVTLSAGVRSIVFGD